MATINDKHKAFAREYVANGFNATQAAIQAGYSPRSARRQGHVLLHTPEIQAMIGEWKAKAEKKAEKRFDATLERVLGEYARIAFSGMSKFVHVDDDGVPRVDLSKCTPDDLDLLSEVQTETLQSGDAPPLLKIKIKPLDKLNALEKLARHLGAFKDRVEHDVSDGLADLLARAQGTAFPIATASRPRPGADEGDE